MLARAVRKVLATVDRRLAGTASPRIERCSIGGLVFFAGQIAVDFLTGEIVGDNIEAQVRKALTNLGAA